MVKEEEIVADAGGRGYMDLFGLGEDDYLLCLSPSSYFSSSAVSTTTTSATAPAASSPTCASFLDLAPAYHHMLSCAGQEQYKHGGNGVFGFQCYGGDQAIPVAVPQKSSPTNECSSISSMSSSPPATTISAISSPKPQAFKKKASRSSDQRKAAPAAAAAAATAASTNKRTRVVRREKLGERIIALQQLVSPFGKSDTASVLHEALGYIRFLHDQVQALSSPYMQQCQPASAHAPAQESAPGTVRDLRSRGLCLVPVSCTEHVAGAVHGHGHTNGADLWSVAAGMAKAAAESKGAATGALPGGGHGHHGHLA